MKMRANMCGFPDVRKARLSRMTRRTANAPSTIARKVGCNDDPGLRILLKKDSSGFSPVGNSELDEEAMVLVHVLCQHHDPR